MPGFRDKDKQEINARLEAVEKAVATQAAIDLQVRQAIANLANALTELDKRAFVFGQQLTIIMKKAEDTAVMTDVLEQEANTLKVDANAYRDAISGLGQRVDALYTGLENIAAMIHRAFDPAKIFLEQEK